MPLSDTVCLPSLSWPLLILWTFLSFASCGLQEARIRSSIFKDGIMIAVI